MSKETDELLRQLWQSKTQYPMEPERGQLTDEELEVLERTQALPPQTEAPAEPPQAEVKPTEEEGVFIVDIPLSQLLRYARARARARAEEDEE